MKKIPALQSLRAIAALLVVFDHSAQHLLRLGFQQIPFLGLFAGSQGVAIFFIISGFIITYTADSPDKSTSRISGAIHFAKRRIARIVPLYWFCTILIAIPTYLLKTTDWKDVTVAHLLKSLFFVPYVNIFGNLIAPIYPPGWTLNHEMAFYAAFTVLILLPYRFRIPMLISIFSILVAIGAFLYPPTAGFSRIYSATSGHSLSVGQFSTDPIMLLFCMGACLALLYQKYPRTIFDRLPGLPIAAFLLLLNGAIALLVHQDPFRPGWYLLCWIIDCMIVALCIFGSPIRLHILETIGDASYSLYLIHPIPILACLIVWKWLHFAAPPVFILVSFLLASITAIACYRWIEHPLTRAFLRLLEGPAKRVESAAPAAENFASAMPPYPNLIKNH